MALPMTNLPTRIAQHQVKETASTTGDPVEWWYMNGLLEAPGTPIDGWALVMSLPRFGTAIEEGRFLLIPAEKGAKTLDFGTRRLTAGTIKASAEELDVQIGEHYLRGGYPSYEIGISGQAGDTYCAAELSYEAELAPEKLTHLDGQLNHLVCYRLRAKGTVTVGDETYPVEAVGFYERVYGSLGWEPGETTLHVDGWNWYWSPFAGPDQLAVEVWSFSVAGDNQPAPYISIEDGDGWLHFKSGQLTTVEERDIHGIPYPHKIRITDQNEHGELDLTITRRDVDSRSLTGPSKPKRMYFVTGYADFEGFARIGNREISLTGKSFGSAYEMSTNW